MNAARRDGRWGSPLHCGPFAAERYGTTLRWLAAGGRECVRMIVMVVRDRQWRTLLPDPASVRQRVQADGRWRVFARTPVGRAVLAWRFDVEPRPRGIDVSVDMTAEGNVATNRAGLVVLLPAATFAGAHFTALHGERESTRGRLPMAIAPHQPMVDLTGLRIAAPRGPVLALDFHGDDFEMEDQRNWLDPTFKLYSRSLARPFPYRIRDGASVAQRVVVELIGAGPRRPSPGPAPRRGRLPSLGIATAPTRVPKAEAVVAALRSAAPQFVMHRTDAAARGVHEARRLASRLDAKLRIEAFGERERLLDALVRADAQAVALHSASMASREALRTRAPTVALTGGTFADFVMLNRNGVAPNAERVAFALCPTVHARDDRSLIETLDALPAVIAQARRIASHRPLDLGPASLRRRLVPRNGAPADKPVSKDGVPYDVDPRQGLPIAAAWLAAAVATAGARGADTFTAFEASGARGLVGDREPFDAPRGMEPGRPSASHAVFAALGATPRARLVLHDVNPFTGAAFAVALGQPELWLVDLAGRARDVPRTARRQGTLRLDDARHGARWAPLLKARVPAFCILRIPVMQLDDDATRAVAQAWCRPAVRPNAPVGQGGRR